MIIKNKNNFHFSLISSALSEGKQRRKEMENANLNLTACLGTHLGAFFENCSQNIIFKKILKTVLNCFQ